MFKGLENLTYKKRLQEKPEKRRLRGTLIHVYKYLTGECGGCNGEGARLFSAAPTGRTRGNRQELTHRKEKTFSL